MSELESDADPAAAPGALDRGRDAYLARRWRPAVDELTAAHASGVLSPPDLERLATATTLIGRPVDGVDILIRAHEGYIREGAVVGAARSGFWIGMQLMFAGQRAPSGGWFARARRLVEESPEPCSIEGFLLVPVALGALYQGDPEGAGADFARAAQIGERFGDRDLIALSRLGMGQAQVMLGHPDRGLELFDEVMVAVTAGEVSPIPAGIAYCAVIDGCHLAFDIHRAQEWTTALDRWCLAQPDLVHFSGQCLARRAELYCLHGAWADALEAARSAITRLRRGDRDALFGANYQQGELQRLQGDLDGAEESYRRAADSGFDPQPGLALLRLAQGRPTDARTMILRAIDGGDEGTRRRRLPAIVEIHLAADDVESARHAADQLRALAGSTPMPLVQAIAKHADGAVLLAEGDPAAAVVTLRTAWRRWMEIDAPFEAARCRVLIGRACRALGDEDSALMDFEAARSVFGDLGAAPALASVDALLGRRSARAETRLTARELEVVRLVATGATNRQVARALFVAEKTVARHLSNVFTKLDLTSRAAVTAYAYEHDLL